MSSNTPQEPHAVGLASPGTDGAATASFHLHERRGLELVNVRGDARASRFHEAIGNAARLKLPTVPNTISHGTTHDALWLGPDEWLLQSLEPCERRLAASLEGMLEGQVCAVVDVSSGSTVLELGGSRAREVLQKGCPLDLHPRAFPLHQCAQSHFFKAGILLRRRGECGFEIAVRRSYAGYVTRLLFDSAAEFTGESK